MICIIDPVSHMPGLKLIFPEADYYSYEPDNNFRFPSTPHFTNNEFFNNYGFYYKTDWNNINSDIYSIIIIVFPFLDAIEGSSWTKKEGVYIMKIIGEIISKNNFKNKILFDIYDYDYDPSKISKINFDIYFKRNYNKNKIYSKNVYPFPCSMFVKPCILTMMINKKYENKQNINGIFWAGTLFDHVDDLFKVYRNRKNIYSKIQNYIDTYYHLPHDEFVNKIKNYRICLDLQGVGDPNKRTFEILSNGSLLFTNICDLNWGFEEGDSFSEETIFYNEIDFIKKSEKLLNNNDLYNKCLTNQRYLVDKYFSKDYLRNYIFTKVAR
jgi:hypothetical protein